MKVVILGGDGTGKTSVIKKIKEYRPDWLFHKQPDYESETGKQILDYLSGEKDLSILETFDLYAKNRSDYISKGLIDDSKINIIDRWTYCNIAYQLGRYFKCDFKDVENKAVFQILEEYMFKAEERLNIPEADYIILLDKRYKIGDDIHEQDKVLQDFVLEYYKYIMPDLIPTKTTIDGIAEEIIEFIEEL